VAIVEAELGAPLGALYADFDREPFAAGLRRREGRGVGVQAA
jgi:hypothetical protein